MAYRPPFRRLLRRLLPTVFVAGIAIMSLAGNAAARVSIVPGVAKGGGTETFAIRMSNERSVPTTRLELTFPDEMPIAVAEVIPTRGWAATITPRELDKPLRVGDRKVDQVAGSIVWAGGSVPSGQFEQFLVKLGPLPHNGKLVLTAAQHYADGTVDRWGSNPEPGHQPAGAKRPAVDRRGAAPPTAPNIAFGTDSTKQAVPTPDPQQPEPARMAAPPDNAGDGTDPLLWGVLLAGGAVVAVTAFRARQRSRPTESEIAMEAAEK